VELVDVYVFPRSMRIYFYRHRITGETSFEKPWAVDKHDRKVPSPI